MISASDAKKLVQLSAENVKNHLDKIEKAIISTASDGKSQLSLSNAMSSVFPYSDNFKITIKKELYPPELNEFQKTIKKELMAFGYGVKIDEYPVQIGGGLGSLYDKVKMGTAFQFLITW